MFKSVAELVDEISITNVKIALLLEKGENATIKDFQKVQKLNRYRSKLKNALSRHFEQETEIKT